MLPLLTAMLGFGPQPISYGYDSYDPGSYDDSDSIRQARGSAPQHCLSFRDVASKWFEAYAQMAGDNVCTKNKLYKNMKKMCVPALAIAVTESYDTAECTAASGHPFDSSAGSGCVMRGIWQITGCSSNPDLNLPGFSENDGNPPVVTHAKAIYLNLTSNDPDWGCNGEYSGKENTATIQGIQQKQSPQYGATGHRFCAGTCATQPRAAYSHAHAHRHRHPAALGTGGSYQANVEARVEEGFKTLKKACKRALRRLC